MRVIAGTARGTKLLSLEGNETRPTLDRVKESVFNMIQVYLYDAVVLDLFAGTGAIGIEALSRGAQKAIFVDRNEKSIEVIKKNLEKTHLSSQAEVNQGDVFSIMEKLYHRKIEVDMIYLDPPFAKGFYTDVLKTLAHLPLLRVEGIIVAEYPSDYTLEVPEPWEVIKHKKYGNIQIALLQKEAQ